MIRFGAVLALLFLILLTAPMMFKGKILTAAKEAASSSVMAKIDFDDDIDLSLIRNFPNLSVGINNLKIVGVDSFERDTLFSTKNLRLVVDISSVVGGDQPIGLKKIYVNQPRINVHVLPSGKANYDIVPADSTDMVVEEEPSESTFTINLEDIEVLDAFIRYHDASMGVDFESASSDFIASGSYKGDLFSLVSTFTSQKMNVSYEGLTAISKAQFKLDSELDMDLEKFRFDIAKLDASLNELPLNMKGWLQMNDDNMEMDLSMGVPRSEFKSLLSAVPGCYSSDFDQVDAKGKMNFSLDLKGVMDEVKMPSSDVKLKIENASFHYPDLPKSVTGINLDLHLQNKDGIPDHSIVDLKNFSLKLGEDPLSMKLYSSQPISNPYAKGDIQAAINLDNWKDVLPMDSGLNVSGVIRSSLSFEGHYASIEEEKFDNLRAEGSIELEGFQFESHDLLPLKIPSFKATANPHAFKISPSSIQYGSSAVRIEEGTLDNAIAYALNDEKLSGKLLISSESIDLNEWMGSEESSQEEPTAETKDTTALEAPNIPHNLDMFFQGRIGRLLYDEYNLTDCQASIHVNNGRLMVDPIQANLWGSRFRLNTEYAYEEGGKPHVMAGIDLENLVPKNVGNSFSMLQTFAPIVTKFDAPVNLKMDFNTNLTEDLSPLLNELDADGVVKVTQATHLESPKWLSDAFEKLQWGKDKIKDVKIKPGTLGFAIHDGKLSSKDSIRLDVYKGSNMAFTGSVDLDQNLDFRGIFNVEGKLVPIRIAGTTSKPKLLVDWKKLGLKVVEEYKEKVVDAVKKEATEVTDDLIAKAEEKAQIIRAEATNKAQQVRDKGREMADLKRAETDRLCDMSRQETDKQVAKLLSSAKNPIQKMAAEKAATAARKKSEQKIKKIQEAGYKNAEKIEQEANDKGNKIEQTAQEKSNKILKEAKTKQKDNLK